VSRRRGNLNTVNDYWTWRTLEGGALTKPGIQGFPGLEPAQALLLEAMADLDLSGVSSAVDLSARGGAVVLALRELGIHAFGTDDSASSLLALRELGIVDNDAAHALGIRTLSGERGNARVYAELHALWTRLESSGVALIVGDKDKGFERYLKTAVAWFGEGEIIWRSKGCRVARLLKTRLEPPPPPPETRFTIEARGRTLSCVAHAGAFSSGKLDTASALLLEHLPVMTGKRVLDIGAGYGALGGFLALEGAQVTLLEVDAPSVRSTRDTLALNGLEGTVLHSDVDSALAPEAHFDTIVMNPPFHVGRDLKLDVALEFIRATQRHLVKGGSAWLVANHFLPYETPLRDLGLVQEVARERGFKLLKVGR
jgi:16S rRNA (guanine1207-N2)-methyltransferase